MTKKETYKEAKRLILAGASRQEAFSNLKATSTLKEEDLVTVVRYIPTLQARATYRTPWLALVVLLFVTIALKLLIGSFMVMGGNPFGWIALLLMPVINVIAVIGILNYRGEFFRLIAVLTIIGALRLITNGAAGGFDVLFLLDLLILGAIIGLSFYLNARMVSAPAERKERYHNPQGQERLRKVFVFEER
jgi:hypothetical protein